MLRASDNRMSDKPAYSASEAQGDKPLLIVRNVGIEFGGIAALRTCRSTFLAETSSG